jgi:hypothetical protein
MAKKSQKQVVSSDIFAKTETEEVDDPVRSIGVGLKTSEGERLKQIAEELGTNRHGLLLWLVRDFMRRWDEGDRPPTETKRVLKS